MKKYNIKPKFGAEVEDHVSTIFCVTGEMIKDNGEDCYYYGNRVGKTLISVFDGCGGMGAKRYNNYSGKTGAYISSRAVSGTVQTWFETTEGDLKKLPEYIQRALNVCDKFADKGGRILGSLGKAFPTTAAMTLIDGSSATCIWAGDSRCYMLDGDGLHQLTEDDVDDIDALSNISDDGVLKNVISKSVELKLNQKTIKVKKPCILFCASDGCFAYLESPMDFEHMLTTTLLQSQSLSEWKDTLDKRIREYTGDDYTICVAALGYQDFNSIRKSFAARNEMVYGRFIQSTADINKKWDVYKEDYSVYLKNK